MGILNSFNIGAQGLDAHGKRMQVHAKNIANIDTPNYVRKIPVLISKDDISFSGLMTYMKKAAWSLYKMNCNILTRNIMKSSTNTTLAGCKELLKSAIRQVFPTLLSERTIPRNVILK